MTGYQVCMDTVSARKNDSRLPCVLPLTNASVPEQESSQQQRHILTSAHDPNISACMRNILTLTPQVLGLLLGTQAPAMMLSSVDFYSSFSFLDNSFFPLYFLLSIVFLIFLSFPQVTYLGSVLHLLAHLGLNSGGVGCGLAAQHAHHVAQLHLGLGRLQQPLPDQVLHIHTSSLDIDVLIEATVIPVFLDLSFP